MKLELKEKGLLLDIPNLKDDIAKAMQLLYDTGVPHCHNCFKPMINAYDSISKKKSKHLWRYDCKCLRNKNIRICLG